MEYNTRVNLLIENNGLLIIINVWISISTYFGKRRNSSNFSERVSEIIRDYNFIVFFLQIARKAVIFFLTKYKVEIASIVLVQIFFHKSSL